MSNSRWPFTVPNTVVWIDYSRGVPGVLTYTDLTEIDPSTGELRRIAARTSQVIPDGISLGYPSQTLLHMHIVQMGWHKQRLAEFDTSPTGVAAPTVERPVLHVSRSEGRKWQRVAEQGGLW